MSQHFPPIACLQTSQRTSSLESLQCSTEAGVDSLVSACGPCSSPSMWIPPLRGRHFHCWTAPGVDGFFLELKSISYNFPLLVLILLPWVHPACLFLFLLSIFEDKDHIAPDCALVKTQSLGFSAILSVKLFPELLPSWPQN